MGQRSKPISLPEPEGPVHDCRAANIPAEGWCDHCRIRSALAFVEERRRWAPKRSVGADAGGGGDMNLAAPTPGVPQPTLLFDARFQPAPPFTPLGIFGVRSFVARLAAPLVFFARFFMASLLAEYPWHSPCHAGQ
jgi:hypothetical protein